MTPAGVVTRGARLRRMPATRCLVRAQHPRDRQIGPLENQLGELLVHTERIGDANRERRMGGCRCCRCHVTRICAWTGSTCRERVRMTWVWSSRLGDCAMIGGKRARSFGAAAGVIGLLLAAILGVTLAADILRSENRIAMADAAFTSGQDQKVTWEADTVLPGGVSRGVLGLGDDLAFRNAVRRFWLSKPRAPLKEFGDVTRQSGAERELARLGESDASPERRGVVLTMRGALLLEEARNTTTQRQVFVRRAIEQFRKAVVLDPSNADAVYNLELALKLLRRSGADPDEAGAGRAPLPAAGAGAATSGTGF